MVGCVCVVCGRCGLVVVRDGGYGVWNVGCGVCDTPLTDYFSPWSILPLTTPSY